MASTMRMSPSFGSISGCTRASASRCWNGRKVLLDAEEFGCAWLSARFPVLGAYELALKCSHVFNLLDARGAITVTERVGVMARIRKLIVGVAKMYAEQGTAVELLGPADSAR